MARVFITGRFRDVVDLLRVAKHGRGEKVYLVRFHYMPPRKLSLSRPAARRRLS